MGLWAKEVRTVYAVSVTSRHLFADIFQSIRNMLGMDLVAYERMIEDAIEKALHKLYKKFPKVYDVKITTSMTSMGAAEIIVYGKVSGWQKQ